MNGMASGGLKRRATDPVRPFLFECHAAIVENTCPLGEASNGSSRFDRDEEMALECGENVLMDRRRNNSSAPRQSVFRRLRTSATSMGNGPRTEAEARR